MKTVLLTQKQKSKIDDSDVDVIKDYKWYAIYNKKTKTFYAQRADGLGMHRLIMGLQKYDKIMVDHKNHNTLDNRKQNLRLCSNSQNQYNRKLNKNSTSGIKGLSFNKTIGKWDVRISVNKKQVFIGYFDCKEMAINQYKKATKILHKEFAYKK